MSAIDVAVGSPHSLHVICPVVQFIVNRCAEWSSMDQLQRPPNRPNPPNSTEYYASLVPIPSVSINGASWKYFHWQLSLVDEEWLNSVFFRARCLIGEVRILARTVNLVYIGRASRVSMIDRKAVTGGREALGVLRGA